MIQKFIAVRIKFQDVLSQIAKEVNDFLFFKVQKELKVWMYGS